MATPDSDRTRPSARDTMMVLVAVVLGVSFIGFALGVSDPAPTPAPVRALSSNNTAPEVTGEVPVAPAYAAMSTADVDEIRGSEPVEPDTLDVALAARAERRAYDGAPPVVPHPVQESAAAECLACHLEGTAIRGRVARPIPHLPYASCSQCHVVDGGSPPAAGWLEAEAAFGAENGFDGVRAPEGGPRAWPVAPPQIPHSTWMREACLSCHGPRGAQPMRSTHPERTSCTQCHAPSAELERAPFVMDAPFPGGG